MRACVCVCVCARSCVCMCVCVCALEDVADMPAARLKTPPLTVISLLARTLDCSPYIPLLKESHVTGNDLLMLELAVVNFWGWGGSSCWLQLA